MFTTPRFRALIGLILLGSLGLAGCGEDKPAPNVDPSLVPPPGQAADDLPKTKAK